MGITFQSGNDDMVNHNSRKRSVYEYCYLVGSDHRLFHLGNTSLQFLCPSRRLQEEVSMKRASDTAGGYCSKQVLHKKLFNAFRPTDKRIGQD